MKTMSLFLVLVAGTISYPAWSDNDFTAAQIREMVRQGKILPLTSLLEKYAPLAQGRLLDLEVEKKRGQIIYEMKFLRKNGDVLELKVNAETGELLKQEIE